MDELYFERLRNLVARGELAIVIEQLATETAPEGYRNAILQLSARYRELRNELIAGTQDPDQTTRTKNRLNQTTLKLLDAMERGEPFEVDTPAEATTIIQGKNIVTGNVSNVGGDFRVGDNQGE
jgi:hypothetical protein